MSLLLPVGLIALAALPVIIVLHMRNTTPLLRTVPTLRFWRMARPEPVERVRWRRPPITLLLILQLLVAAALAFALARPVTSRALDALGISTRSGPLHLIVLLDGSTSMSATDAADGRTRFDAARDTALSRLGGLREGDVATLLVMGTHITTQGATDASSLTLLRQRLATLSPAGGRAELNDALTLANALLLPDRDNQILLLTDGAMSVDASVAAATGAEIELVDVSGPAAAGNVGVVDLAARAEPGNSELFELYARAMNFSPDEQTIPVMLTGDGLEIDRQLVTIPPNGGTVELSWPLPSGTTQATVSLESADPLTADNEASVILRQGAEADLALKILLISDAPAALHRGLTAIAGAQVTTESSARLESALSIASYDLIVFEQASPTADQLATVTTPMLFVNPRSGDVFPSSGTIIEPDLTQLRAHDPLLAGVDLAGVVFGETPRYDIGAGSEVAGAAEGPLIFRTPAGDAPAIVFAFDLARSNLPRRVAFPILLANAVNELAPSPLPAAVPLGEPLLYRPRAAAAAVRVSPPAGEPVELAIAGGLAESGAAELRDVSFANTGQPGVYTVTELDADGNELGGGRFMVNAGHERESDLRPNPALAETLALATASETTGPTRHGLTDLWPALVTIAGLLLAAEWLIALLPRWRPLAVPTPARRS